MKVINGDFASRCSSQEMMRKLAALLGVWRRDSFRQRGNKNSEHELRSAKERLLWEEFLRNSEVWLPRDVEKGFAKHLEHHNRTSNATEVLIREVMEKQGSIKSIGKRIAVASSDKVGISQRLGGYKWTLVASVDNLKANREEVGEVVGAQFRTITINESVIMGAEPGSSYRAENAICLARLAINSENPEQILEICYKALALDVSELFIKQLPDIIQQELAGQITKELVEARDELDWQTDIELEVVIEGYGTAFKRKTGVNLPRLAEYYLADNRLSCFHAGLLPDYYTQLAETLVLVGDVTTLGNTLAELPPGRALFGAMDTLCQRRPAALAELSWHPSWELLGAFAISERLPQVLDQSVERLDLSDEWKEVQKTLRRLVIERSQKWCVENAVELAIADEKRLYQSNLSVHLNERKALSLAEYLQPWISRIENEQDATKICKYLVKRIENAGRFERALAGWTLRTVSIFIKHKHNQEAKRLSGAFVKKYKKEASPENIHPYVNNLSEYGPELAALAKALTDDSYELKATAKDQWLSPFDLNPALLKLKEGQPRAGHASGGYNIFPLLLKTHLSNLMYQIENLEPPAGEYMLCIACRIYLNVRRETQIIDFITWIPEIRWPSVPSGQPFLVRVGEQAGRHGGPGKKVIREFVRRDLGVLELAQIASGLGREHSLFGNLEGHIMDLCREDRKRTKLHFGKTVRLADALYRIGKHEQSLQYTEKALLAQPKSANEYVFSAHYVFFANCMALEDWKRIISFEPRGKNVDLQVMAWNFQALAFLYEREFTQGRELLNKIIKKKPKDKMALVNLAAMYLAEEKWEQALATAKKVRNKLGEDTPGKLAETEAFAFWNNGEIDQAANVLNKLPKEMRNTPSIIRLRVDLAVATSPGVERLKKDLDELYKRDPELARDLKKRIQPFSTLELGAGMMYADSPRKRRTFEEKCRDQQEDPWGLLLSHLRNACEWLTEQPWLAQKLDEDGLTEIVAMLCNGLRRYGVLAKVGSRGGHGPKRQGVADLCLYDDGLNGWQERTLVKGEAKYWNGQAWLKKGLDQAFGTANVRPAFFVAVIIYCKLKNFGDCLKKIEETIGSYSCREGEAKYFACTEVKKVEELSKRETVVVFKSKHPPSSVDDHYSSVDVYTFVADMKTYASKAVRKRTTK